MAAPEDMRRIGKAVWEIPTSYKKGMRLAGRIFADEKLLSGMEEGVFA